MLNLSTANRTALTSDVPWPVDLVQITINNTANGTLRLTNHFHDLSVDGETYTAAAQFLNFSDIADNMEVKDNTLDISLNGLDSVVIAAVLGTNIEGSLIEVFRGFYDESTGALVDDPFPRWSGRINNYSITDDYLFTEEDKVAVSISCKSLLTTIIAKVSGRYTSPQGFGLEGVCTTGTEGGNVTTEAVCIAGGALAAQWSADVSMEFVPSLTTFNPNFGAEE